MAALAVTQTIVVDDEWCPIGGVVADVTIFTGMVGWCFVAGCAVGVACVIEYGRFPIFGVMAGGALKVVVWCRIVFFVARNTIVISQVIEGGIGPVFRVGVAVNTRAGFAGDGRDHSATGANRLVGCKNQ